MLELIFVMSLTLLMIVKNQTVNHIDQTVNYIINYNNQIIMILNTHHFVKVTVEEILKDKSKKRRNKRKVKSTVARSPMATRSKTSNSMAPMETRSKYQ